jgi:hypothetical protein
LHRLLSIQYNYENKERAQSALQYIRAVRTKLAELLRGPDGKYRLSEETCEALMSPSWMWAAWPEPAIAPDAAVELKCDSLLSVESYLDPGMLAHVIRRERDGMVAATQVPKRGWLGPWWRQHADSVLMMRKIQLAMVNEAIGQQSLIAGASSVAKLAERLNDPITVKALGEVMVRDSMLTENVVTNWTIGRLLTSMLTRPGTATAYGIAYWTGEPDILRAVLDPPSHLAIVDASACGDRAKAWQASTLWALQFTVSLRPEGKPNEKEVDISQCVPLPTPATVATRRLRAPKTVETLMGLRRELLQDIEGLSMGSQLETLGLSSSPVLWRLRASASERATNAGAGTKRPQ